MFSGRGGVSKKEIKSRILAADFNDKLLKDMIKYLESIPDLPPGFRTFFSKTEAKSLLSQKDPLTITIDSTGKIFIQDEEVLSEQLAAKLNAIIDNGYEEKIYIRGDRSTEYGKILKVMARINTAGFENIGLVTDPINQ